METAQTDESRKEERVLIEVIDPLEMRARAQHHRCVHCEKDDAGQTQKEDGYLRQPVLSRAQGGGNSN
jgi:hypothetical protein